MLPSRVKDFVKDCLGKVFAACRQRSSTTDHQGDGSIHAHTPSTFSFPSPTSGGTSPAREASDMVQLALPLVQAVASAIPLVGAPMQAAIGGLLAGLQAIDRRSQNKADLKSLNLRLDRLIRDLCNAPPPRNPLEQSRRDTFVSMLQDTSTKVSDLQERYFASTSVTQDITRCFTEIDRYLADYLLSSQMQMFAMQQRQEEDHRRQEEYLMRIELLLMRGQSSVGPTATDLIGTATRGCVTLVDATGHRHPISVSFCTSFEQFNDMLKVLFKCNSAEAQIQRRYMESGKYDLCIDEGPRVTQLTNNQWSTLEEGTTVVMRVIIEQQTTSSEVSYKCPCGAVNTLGVGSVMYSFERQAGCSIDCRTCGRRFQISRVPSSTNWNALSSNIDSDDATDTEMDLLRNFHVRQIRSWNRVQCTWENCKKVMQRENLTRHVHEVHLGTRRTTGRYV